MVYAYVAVSLATLGALAVISVTTPATATPDAWGHGAIVAVFAIVLPLRARAACRGSAGSLRALLVLAVRVRRGR